MRGRQAPCRVADRQWQAPFRPPTRPPTPSWRSSTETGPRRDAARRASISKNTRSHRQSKRHVREMHIFPAFTPIQVREQWFSPGSFDAAPCGPARQGAAPRARSRCARRREGQAVYLPGASNGSARVVRSNMPERATSLQALSERAAAFGRSGRSVCARRSDRGASARRTAGPGRGRKAGRIAGAYGSMDPLRQVSGPQYLDTVTWVWAVIRYEYL